MFKLVLVLILISPIAFLLFAYVRRARACTWADQVIAGSRQATTAEINGCINVLSSYQNGLVGCGCCSRRDGWRIEQLLFVLLRTRYFENQKEKPSANPVHNVKS